MSGPIGTYSNIDQRVEKIVAKKLKFSIEPVSTQIIPRDRHAELFSVFSLIASSLERLATEIRHLQRTEVLEVEEGFGKGQKGSSAMPHKKILYYQKMYLDWRKSSDLLLFLLLKILQHGMRGILVIRVLKELTPQMQPSHLILLFKE